MGLNFNRPDAPTQTAPAAQAELEQVKSYDIVVDRKQMSAELVGSKEVDDIVSTIEVNNLETIVSFGAMAGSVLKLHPKIIVENGAMDAAKKYRGKLHSVVMSYVRDMEANLKNARPERVFITHSGCDRKIVEDVQAYLQSLGIFQEILETRAGGVVSSHCGPGTLGVLFIAK